MMNLWEILHFKLKMTFTAVILISIPSFLEQLWLMMILNLLKFYF